jgi:hypothetical protein
MKPEDEIVPGQDEVRQAGQALAWVLSALFAYSNDIGLKHAVFW